MGGKEGEEKYKKKEKKKRKTGVGVGGNAAFKRLHTFG